MEPCTSWTSEWYDIRLVFGREIGREEGGDEERQKRVEETRLWYTRTAPHVRRTFHFWLFLMPITNWLRLTSKCRSEMKWCDFRIESKSPRSHFDSTATLDSIEILVLLGLHSNNFNLDTIPFGQFIIIEADRTSSWVGKIFPVTQGSTCGQNQ